ncbi:MAG: ABC transporter permease subunit [Hyphomicrobiales bacterium]
MQRSASGSPPEGGPLPASRGRARPLGPFMDWWERPGSKPVFLLAPTLLFLAVVLATSLFDLARVSLEYPAPTIRQYLRILGDASLMRVLGNTLSLATMVTLMSFILGYPVALTMIRASPRRQRLIALILILPLWTSVLVRSYGWMVVLGRQGVINQLLVNLGLIAEPLDLLYSRTAVYIGMVHVMLPFMTLPIFSVMKQVDMRLVRAARSLGANRLIALLMIFFPLTLPGVAVGSILVFISSLAFWVTPTLLGGLKEATYVMVIEREVNVSSDWPYAAAMSIILLAITLVILTVYQRALGFGLTGSGTAAGNARGRWLLHAVAMLVARLAPLAVLIQRIKERRGRPQQRAGKLADAAAAFHAHWHRLRFSWSGIVTGAVMVYLLAPLLILIPLSFTSAPFMQFPPPGYSLQWFARYFSESNWIYPTITSFEVAILTMLVATILGTMAAVGLQRAALPLKSVVLSILLSPLIVPPIILAVALYFEFAPFHLIDTRTGLVIAHSLLATPFVILVVLGNLQTADETLEQAARSLGARPFRAFFRITFPLIRAGVITAVFFAFLTSFDEVIMAVFLSGSKAATLPRRLLDAVRFEFKPTIAAVSTLLILLSCLAVFAVELAKLRGRGGGRPTTASPPADPEGWPQI